MQPDKDRIISYTAKEYSLDKGCAAEALKILVDKRLVYLKSTPSGQDSYFIAKEDDAYNMEIEQLLVINVPYHQSILESWPSGRVSASQLVGHGFEPRPSHMKDFNNGTHCLLIWHSTYENGVGKLNFRS